MVPSISTGPASPAQTTEWTPEGLWRPLVCRGHETEPPDPLNAVESDGNLGLSSAQCSYPFLLGSRCSVRRGSARPVALGSVALDVFGRGGRHTHLSLGCRPTHQRGAAPRVIVLQERRVSDDRQPLVIAYVARHDDLLPAVPSDPGLKILTSVGAVVVIGVAAHCTFRRILVGARDGLMTSIHRSFGVSLAYVRLSLEATVLVWAGSWAERRMGTAFFAATIGFSIR